jgi:hypothetical protein
MSRSIIRRILAAITLLATTVGAELAAQTTTNEATAARIVGPSGRTDFARAVLGAGEMSETSLDRVRDSRLASDLATAVTTGVQGGAGGTSVATLSNLDLLSGLITAGEVIAVATSHAGGTDASGSGFSGLAIRGIVLPTGDAVAPNTRIALPGVGYVVLNEQLRDGASLTVNMIRLVVESTKLTPRRELVVATATAAR